MKSETYDPNEMLKKWGKKVAILGWYEIQTAFYRALPPDTVVFNSRRVTLTLQTCRNVESNHWTRYCKCQEMQRDGH